MRWPWLLCIACIKTRETSNKATFTFIDIYKRLQYRFCYRYTKPSAVELKTAAVKTVNIRQQQKKMATKSMIKPKPAPHLLKLLNWNLNRHLPTRIRTGAATRNLILLQKYSKW